MIMQKTKPIRSTKHLQFIRKLPCCVCGQMPCDAAHIRIGMFGGTGMKPGDDCTVPLCAPCHARQHQHGEATFYGASIGSAKWLAKRLYQYSGDAFKALQAIQIYREDANL